MGWLYEGSSFSTSELIPESFVRFDVDTCVVRGVTESIPTVKSAGPDLFNEDSV